MSARSPTVRPVPALPSSTPTTPVLPMPRWTSMPQAWSLSATRAEVRTSSKPISGWACRSWRMATRSSLKASIRGKTGITISFERAAGRPSTPARRRPGVQVSRPGGTRAGKSWQVLRPDVSCGRRSSPIGFLKSSNRIPSHARPSPFPHGGRRAHGGRVHLLFRPDIPYASTHSGGAVHTGRRHRHRRPPARPVAVQYHRPAGHHR